MNQHSKGWISGVLAAVVLHLSSMLPVAAGEEAAEAVERCRASAWVSSNGVGDADAFVDWDTGLRVCDEALVLAPQDPVALAAYGRALYTVERYPEALKVMRRAAASGHPYGQFGMGVLFDFGYGVDQDDAKAVAWYRKAAEQDYAPAQHNLGAKYADGQGVEQDDAEAVAWHRKAAEAGYARAEYSLGEKYENGMGVERDDAQAVAWYRKAAEQGHAAAQINLGWMYENGQGVARDVAQAASWYRAALEAPSAADRLEGAESFAATGTRAGLPELFAALALDSDAEVRTTVAGVIGWIGFRGQLDAMSTSDATSELLAALAADPDSEVRAEAAAALSMIHPDKTQVVSALVEALVGDQDAEVRAAAAWALADLGAFGVSSDLAKALINDCDASVRERAAYAFGQLGGLEELPVLLEALTRSGDATVRRTVAEALGWFPPDRVVPALIATLTSDSASDVREAIASSIANLNAREAEPALITMLEDPDLTVRRAVARALVELGNPEGIVPLLELLEYSDESEWADAVELLGESPYLDVGRAYPFLLRSLADGPTSVRLAAVRVIAEQGFEEAVPQLSKLLEDADPDVRSEAIDALGSLGDSRLLPLLTEFLRHPMPATGAAAAQVLGKLGVPEAVTPLLEALVGDSDSGVRVATAHALGNLGAREAVSALLDILAQDRDSEVRAAAAHALATLGALEAVSPLLETLAQDRDSEVRVAAAQALALLGSREAVLPLIEILARDSNSAVRVAAWRALEVPNASEAASAGLKALPPDRVSEVLPALLETLAGDEDSELRVAAARALAMLGARQAVPAFIEILVQDSDSVVRVAAAQALGQMGAREAVLPLLDALARDVDNELRVAAIHALVKLGAREAVSPLLDTLAPDVEPEVRVAAIYALGDLDAKEAVSPLSDVLARDRDTEVRVAAAHTLGKLGAGEAVHPLVETLTRQSNVALRVAAAEALVQLGAKDEAIRALIAALESGAWRSEGPGSFGEQRWQLPSHIVSLLDDLMPEAPGSVMPTMVGALEHPEVYVRQLAATAIVDSGGLTSLSAGQIREYAPLIGSSVGRVTRRSWQLLALVHYATEDRPRGEVLELLGGLLRAEINAGTLTEAGLEADLATIRAELGEEVRPEDNPYVSLLLAYLFSNGDQHAAALSWSARALERLDPDEVAPAVVLRDIRAWSLAQTGHLREGLAELERAERELLPWVTTFERERLDRPLAAWVLWRKGQLLARAGETEAAQRALEAALERAPREPGPSQEARERVLKWVESELDGVYDRRVGQVLASANGREGIEPRSAPERASDLVRLERGAERALREAREAGDDLEAAEEAYARAHRFMEELALKRAGHPAAAELQSQVPARQAALGRLAQLEGTYQQRTAALAQEEREPTPDQEKLAERKREREAAFKELKRFEEELLREHPQVAVLVAARPAQLRALEGELAPGQVLVQYLLLEERGYAFVLAPERAVAVVDLAVGRRALEPEVRAWRSELEAGLDPLRGPVSLPTAGAPGAPSAAKQLSAWLIAPLAGHLDGARQLILVPNGPLHLLPFAALPVGEGYLAERHPVSVLSGSSLLAVVAAAAPVPTPGLLAVGDPAPPSAKWSPLPHAAAEVASIRRYFPQAEVHPPETAGTRFVSRAVLTERDLTGRVVHLALHGRAGGGEQPQLVFSDGYLGVNDIYGLDLTGSPQVVLSACETGLGEALAGDEVVSLANGFLFAGARRVVSTLWQVPDAGARELMERYYAEQAAGAEPAEALARAQRARIAKHRPPREWAAFVLTGL